jgi:hypothetical protein
MSEPKSHVVNVNEVKETGGLSGEHWGGFDKPLTPGRASEWPRIFELAAQLARSTRA